MSKLRVLVIEDDDDTQVMLLHEMEQEYEVMQAYNGEEGLQMLLAHTPDIILLDLKMSPMSGYQVIEEIERRCLPHVPILILTAFGDVQPEAVALLNHNEYVKKIIAKPVVYISYIQDSIEKALAIKTDEGITTD